jgi:aminopeptidase N
MRHISAILLCSIPISAGPAWAQDSDPRLDENGADTAHYPPARPFDHLHMKLEMDFPDMGKAFFAAHETLKITPIARARKHLDLNAVGEKIESVKVDGADASFTHEHGRLAIEFPHEVPLGQTAEVTIDYTTDFTQGPHEQGLTWIRPRTGNASATDKSPVIYSQGVTEYNRRWFPCHDFPNERLTTELIVTVEDGYTVVSNGHLVGTSLGKPAGDKARTTWHWLQDKPHANYLVTLVIGKYSLVGLPPEGPDRVPKDAAGHVISCNVYAPIGRETQAAESFGHTPSMMAFYNEQFGQIYPWDKYAQVLVRNFNGGMENTSATTMMASLAGRRASAADDIISHELAHQWFGDLMTCKSWEHAWLNEGWASYCEALWFEHAATPDKRDDAYQRTMLGFARTQRSNSTTAPDTPPMVSNRYGFSQEAFMKANDIYSKGALVLHMLRMRLGEETFWKGVRLYIQRYKFKEVETDEFRECLEEASGLDLERFFEQWCRRPGMPRVNAEIEWKATGDGPGGELTVSLAQDQQIDADNPAYALSFPVAIDYEDGSTEWLVLDTETAKYSGTWTLKAKPKNVDLDPNLNSGVLPRVRKPLAMWLHQAEHGKAFARFEAAEHLAGFDSPAATVAMARLATDESEAVRSAAQDGLGGRVRAVALAALEWTRPFTRATVAAEHP